MQSVRHLDPPLLREDQEDERARHFLLPEMQRKLAEAGTAGPSAPHGTRRNGPAGVPGRWGALAQEGAAALSGAVVPQREKTDRTEQRERGGGPALDRGPL